MPLGLEGGFDQVKDLSVSAASISLSKLLNQSGEVSGDADCNIDAVHDFRAFLVKNNTGILLVLADIVN